MPDLQSLVQKMVEGGESEDDIASVIQHYKATKPASAEDFTAQPTQPEGSALGRFLSNAGEMLNPITIAKGIGSAVLHPIDTASHLWDAQVAEFQKAKQATSLPEAVGHGMAAALPLLGPAAAAAGEQIASGDVAGGLGKAAGLVAPAVIGAALPKGAAVKVPGLAKSAGAGAVDLAERAGVPLDAATATGNRFVAAAQHLADRSLAGSVVAGKAAQAQTEGLATLGEQLAAKGYALPVSAEEAGDAAAAGVTHQLRGQAGLANDAYEVVRKAEANPANARPVPGPDGSTQLMPLPVDLRAAKTAIEPIYAELDRQRQLTPFAPESGKARAFAALDTLVKAPDHAPLSVVDSALSDLKAFTRGDGSAPEVASAGQGKVKFAIAHIEKAVGQTADAAGPDVRAALREGRAATTAKYVAKDVLDSLHAEPVKTFNALTAPGDSAINKLRAVAQQAPDVLPQIGRAKLDALLQMAPDKGFAEWSKMGTATKAMLYQDPAYVVDLDKFFKLTKMAAATPNPSGTAHTLLAAGQGGLIFTNPIAGGAVQLGAAAVSKLLHSRAGVQLLTKGLRIPVANKAAGAAWMADLAAATSPSGSPNLSPARP